MTSALHRRRNAALLVLAVAAAMSFRCGAADAKLYFSSFLGGGGTGIERAGFDGAGLEVLQFQPVGFADGLALDPAAGRMYWTDTNASVIWSANMNGSEAGIVLDDFGAEPLGIALDAGAHKMYWTDSAGVKRANLNGTEAELVSKGPARGFIALDPAAGRMYWADYPTGTLKTAAMSPEAPITNVVSKQPSPFGVALDSAAGKLYWLQLNLEKRKTEKNAIRRANLDGSEIETLIERPGAGFEGGLAIDAVAGRLYWTEAEAHDIGTANLDGTGVQTFSTGQDSPEGLAVESASPRPRSLVAPTIEGSVQVGGLATCNPGAWTGTGPLGYAYQWSIVGAGAIEGATAPWYTPTSDQAGARLVCAVSATDAVDTSTASSAAVGIAPLEGAPPTPIRPALIAGIALARLTGTGGSAHVPVFTSLPGGARLTAVPVPHTPRHGRHADAAAPARRRKRGPRPRNITVARVLPAGRSVLTLHHLLPGRSYLLLFTLVSADGQSASDAATLTVRRR